MRWIGEVWDQEIQKAEQPEPGADAALINSPLFFRRTPSPVSFAWKTRRLERCWMSQRGKTIAPSSQSPELVLSVGLGCYSSWFLHILALMFP